MFKFCNYYNWKHYNLTLNLKSGLNTFGNKKGVNVLFQLYWKSMNLFSLLFKDKIQIVIIKFLNLLENDYLMDNSHSRSSNQHNLLLTKAD